MYEFIEGTFEQQTPSYIVVNAGGVGYHIEISLTTFSDLKALKQGRVLTHLIVREDERILFGFSTKIERDLFRMLLSVNGIGAGTGRMILSSLNCNELLSAIGEGNVAAIKQVKGIGEKTAQRVVLELKDKISKIGFISEQSTSGNNKNYDQAFKALQTLGFNKIVIEKTQSKIMKEASDTITTEDIIKTALKSL